MAEGWGQGGNAAHLTKDRRGCLAYGGEISNRRLQSFLDASFFSDPGFKVGPQVVVGSRDIQFPPDISPVGFDRAERNMQRFGYFLAC